MWKTFTTSTANVFLSYAREDGDKVQRLSSDLRMRGINTWIDAEGVQPDQPWADVIIKAIENAAYCIACFSNAYLSKFGRSFIDEELHRAITSDRRLCSVGMDYIPVRLDDCTIPMKYIERPGGMNPRMPSWIDLSANWDEGIQKLADIVNPGFPSLKDIVSTWVHQEGYKDKNLVKFDLSSTAMSRCVFHPPEAYQMSVWRHTTSWKIIVKPMEFANLDWKRVGVIELGGARHGATVLATYDSTRNDGLEIWCANHEWDEQSFADGFVVASLVLIAWYQDGLGNTYYDDNDGRGYIVRWEPGELKVLTYS